MMALQKVMEIWLDTWCSSPGDISDNSDAPRVTTTWWRAPHSLLVLVVLAINSIFSIPTFKFAPTPFS